MLPEMHKEATQTRKSKSLDESTQPLMHEEEGSGTKIRRNARRQRRHGKA